MVLNILCFHAFSTTIGLFSGDVLYKISNGRNLFLETFFQVTFFHRTFFHRTFLVPKFRTLFPKTFLAVTYLVTLSLQNNFFSGLRVNFIFETLIKGRVGRFQLSRHIRIDFKSFQFIKSGKWSLMHQSAKSCI